jgi:hypothetical protein
MSLGSRLEKSYLDLSSNLMTNLRFDSSFVINVILLAIIGLLYLVSWLALMFFGVAIVLSVPSGRSPSRESESSAISDNTFWNHYIR